MSVCPNGLACCPPEIFQVLSVTCEDGALTDLQTELCLDVEASLEVCADWNADLPVTWALASGTLPTGMTLQGGQLNSSCVILDGTPSALGTFTFTITGTDASGTVGTREYTISIVALTNNSTLPSGTEGDAYSYTFTAEGGDAPYVFVAIGELPPGLTLDPNTGELSGTPLEAGTYTFEIAVTAGVAPPAEDALLVDYEGNRVGDYDGNRIQSRQP